MKRAFLVSAVAAIVLGASGIAAAKGDLREIRISGGNLRDEIRIPATNSDLEFHWGAPPRTATDVSYRVVFYDTFDGEGGRLYPSSPNRYYPAAHGMPAVLMFDSRNWYSLPATLVRRLNSAISFALDGRPLPVTPGDRVVTSWPLLGVDIAVLLAIVGTIGMMRRRFRLRFALASARPA